MGSGGGGGGGNPNNLAMGGGTPMPGIPIAGQGQDINPMEYGFFQSFLPEILKEGQNPMATGLRPEMFQYRSPTGAPIPAGGAPGSGAAPPSASPAGGTFGPGAGGASGVNSAGAFSMPGRGGGSPLIMPRVGEGYGALWQDYSSAPGTNAGSVADPNASRDLLAYAMNAQPGWGQASPAPQYPDWGYANIGGIGG